jgi:ABC-2 type transport system permease protein
MSTTALLRSELLKLRSLPSTYVVIAAAVCVGLGVGVLEMTSTSHHWLHLDPQDRAAFDPVADSFSGFQFAELAFGALGVLTITTEYATGTIHATLLASPQRTRVYAAKLAALTLVVAPICVTSTFAAFILGQRAVAGRHLDVALSDPHVLRAVIGAGLYMVVVTIVGFGLGAVIRNTAAALTVMFALVFLAWPVARAVESFSYLPDRWLLVNAADTLVSTHPPIGPNALRTPSLAMACLELGTYVAVLIAAGAWRANQDL